MAISNKTRKMLWGNSGNRCVLCRTELVQKTETTPANLIIGEECHIISSKKKGPRGNEIITGNFDDYENLILLCANDHKRIDELVELFTVDVLKILKSNHENWLKTTLENEIKKSLDKFHGIKRFKKIDSGKKIIEIIRNAHFFNFDYGDIETVNEHTKIGEFFEELQEYGDILDDIGYKSVTEFTYRLNEKLKEFNKLGYILFGSRENQKMKFGKENKSSYFEVAYLILVKENNSCIVENTLTVNFSEENEIL